ncbi:hypothetical protein FRB96_006619 [Tulasnella sp. 330]|nr:hypothetical protein FRB96_006619 [Tulasnella sp. 330]KAG8881319.1 hypothetical protein FRB97_009661 [Tulasnella sp. 331]
METVFTVSAWTPRDDKRSMRLPGDDVENTAEDSPSRCMDFPTVVDMPSTCDGEDMSDDEVFMTFFPAQRREEEQAKAEKEEEKMQERMRRVAQSREGVIAWVSRKRRSFSLELREFREMLANEDLCRDSAL